MKHCSRARKLPIDVLETSKQVHRDCRQQPLAVFRVIDRRRRSVTISIAVSSRELESRMQFRLGREEKGARIFFRLGRYAAPRASPRKLPRGLYFAVVRPFRGTKFTAPSRVSTEKRILLSGVLKLYVFLHNWKLEIIIVAPSGTRGTTLPTAGREPSLAPRLR